MVIHGNESGTYKATPQVKVFAWLPFGHQLFWLRETFLQTFRGHDQNGRYLQGYKGK